MCRNVLGPSGRYSLSGGSLRSPQAVAKRLTYSTSASQTAEASSKLDDSASDGNGTTSD